MSLVLNEEEIMLRDSAAGFLAETANVDAFRKHRDNPPPAGFDQALWGSIAEMGWCGIAIDEAHGGLGYGFTGLGLIIEQMGKNLTVSPFNSTVLMAGTAIAQFGTEAQKQEWLPKIAAGEVVMSLAIQEGSHFDLDGLSPSVSAQGDGFAVKAEKRQVLDAIGADAYVVVGKDAAGYQAFIVASDQVSVTDQSMVDARSSGTVVIDASLSADAQMDVQSLNNGGLERALDIMNIGLAAELLGVSVEAFERTVGYLRERKQFGKVIGSFQGLQHRAADLFAELELCKAIVLKGLRAVDAGDDLSGLASAVKAKLAQISQRATNEGVQMHGGIGMTDEYDIGFFIKRARVLEHTLGDFHYHLDRYALQGGY
jgi:alkylation response protein AidB-like acyl-CoA dehydrogenase